jgi:hypothetical protein
MSGLTSIILLVIGNTVIYLSLDFYCAGCTRITGPHLTLDEKVMAAPVTTAVDLLVVEAVLAVLIHCHAHFHPFRAF